MIWYYGEGLYEYKHICMQIRYYPINSAEMYTTLPCNFPDVVNGEVVYMKAITKIVTIKYIKEENHLIYVCIYVCLYTLY